jgi:glucokinase
MVNAASIVDRTMALLATGAKSSLAQIARSRALSSLDVGHACDAGDPVAVSVVEETGRILGVGLANLALLFAPDVIVMGGGVSALGERLLEPARREMASRAYLPERMLPRVVPALLGNQAGIVGAALLARDLFSPA